MTKSSPSHKPLHRLEKKVLIEAKKNTLWQAGDTVLIAVSGGADSIALLHVLLALSSHENLSLGVIHVNYNLRGVEARKDALFVEALAKKHTLPFFKKVISRNTSPTDEASLRDIRYTFFAKTAKTRSYSSVALGHQQNDQAETFLLRLLRGSGTVGLQAMQPKRDGYIRPLLSFTRQEILAYLKDKQFDFRQDASNTDLRYLRNRVRHELLPLLVKEYQPNIVPILCRTSTLLTEASQRTVTPTPLSVLETKDSFTFSQSELLALPAETRLTFLRRLIEKLLSKPISYALSKEVEKVITSTKNKTSHITFRGLKVTKKGATVSLQKINLPN